MSVVGSMVGCSPWSGPFDGYYRTGVDQPWGTQGAVSSTCTPRPEGRVLTWGSVYLPNETGDVLTLDRVTLLDPVNVQMSGYGVYEVAKDRGAFVTSGLQPGFPPVGDKVYVRAVGSTYRPGPGVTVPSTDDEAQAFALAVALEPIGQGVSGFRAIELEYHDPTGRAYRAVQDSGLQILPVGADNCP